MQDRIHTYIESLIKKREPIFAEMEQYALEHDVPIMELSGIEALLHMLRIQGPAKILEIGTAIGYSAMRMADALPNTTIVTIERDTERFNEAIHNISRSGLDRQIKVIHADALEISDKMKDYGPFDALFIDAAKGQYLKFFEMYTPYLSENGIIFTDNVLFKGLVVEEYIESKRTRNLVNKIKNYNEWLMNHNEYITSIIPVGDGLAISKKR
ncbi:SAM-dependent methyltransferase [Heyndrickxia shackletonii]|uniref:tRNA 5-hydroxyuridine methyltransferase n=1 Tax=Heyndrickxia shackletonii TaxID=157838 RepID=A0A0Q3WX12_9BACI|nr:O-methyltransferase [Heyndrickxia shackletonii]KQL53459.1 SAM-dependent methyltransferase [Heyndrickxia shackletonii]NEZ00035.1 O-methyltransferase [Heyndrickxia shackletonii]